MNYYWIIGGNLGDRLGLLEKARALMSEKIGVIVRQSNIYQTQAWGYTHQPDFLNQVVVTNSVLSPEEAIMQAQKIELLLGRERHQRWHERTMDIDMLYAENQIIENELLVVPHRYISERKFVLVPLAEIAPDFIHPVLQLSNQQLLAQCSDVSEVKVL